MWVPEVDYNTIWTTILFFGVAYLFGCLNPARIHISINRSNNNKFVKKNKDGSISHTTELVNFGTSNVSYTMGKKWGLLQFANDFFKPIVFSYAFAFPLMIYLPQYFGTVLMPVAISGVIIGHCWPVFWKFKGGEGIATGVGIVFCINWVAGIIGLLTWMIIAMTTKINKAATFWASVTAASMLTIPAFYNMPALGLVVIHNYYWTYLFLIFWIPLTTAQVLKRGSKDFIHEISFRKIYKGFK